MAGEITNVPKTVPNTVNDISAFAKGLGLNEKSVQLLKDVSAILSSRSVNVVNQTPSPNETGKPTGATGVPALDNPGDLKSLQEDLEKLIAFLQLDNEERQAEMAKSRIESQKDSMAAEHKERMDKIDESIKKMEDAAKSRLANRIFGWIGAIVAVAAAVVACVVTGGAAAAFAVAGAAVAVGALIASETGLTDKITEAIADSLQKDQGMSKTDAQLAASLIINLSIMAISLGCSIGGLAAGSLQMGKAVADTVSTVSTVAKTVQSATSIGSTAVGVGSLASGATSTALGYVAESAQADVTELERVMAELQRRLDESEEELNAILEALQNGLSQVSELLASQTDTQADIANHLANMA